MEQSELINLSKVFADKGIPQESVQEEIGLLMGHYSELKASGTPGGEIDAKLAEFMEGPIFAATNMAATRRRKLEAGF